MKKYLLSLIFTTLLSVSGWGQTDLIQNGSFESGMANWTYSSKFNYASSAPCAGTYFAITADVNGYAYTALTNEYVYQNVTIPNNAISATLNFCYKLNTDNSSSGVNLKVWFGASTIATYNYASSNNTWKSISIPISNISNYLGQGLAVQFYANESANNSYWGKVEVDNVSLMVTTTNCTEVKISSLTIDQTVTEPASTSFSIGVTGTGPTYQWEYSMNGGTTWNNVPNNNPYSGTSSTTLNINQTTVSMSGYKYRCKIGGTCTTTFYGNWATLTVNSGCTPVSITNSLSDKNATVGETVNWTVNTSGTSPFTYQWYKNNSPISGQTNSSYTTPSLTSNDHGNTYYCYVTNCYGSNNKTSNTATLTVTNMPVANFVGSPTNGNSPLAVNFTDQSTGTITSRSWDFGDGSTSTLQNPSHTYNSSGTYTVSLTVNGPGGSDSEVKTNYITVNQPITSITVGNLKITGDQITGTAPNYIVSGNINIGHTSYSGYLIQNLAGELTCNTTTKVINIVGGVSFNINGTQGWLWDFYQTQNWNFNSETGTVIFNSRLKLDETSTINLVSSSFKLNFFEKTINASATFLGDNYLQGLGTFETSINLSQIALGLRVAVGTNVTLGPLRLGILENSAGVSFNVVKKKISFDADIGNLVGLKFIGVDGAEFSYSPIGSISLGIEWDYIQKRIIFYKDSKISIGGFAKYISDSTYNNLLKTKRIHYGIGNQKQQLLLDVGLSIKEGSYLDFDDLILFGKASIDIGWHEKLSVTAASVSLNLNFQEGYIYGQILAPGINIADDLKPGGWFNSSENELSFEFDWGNNSLNKSPEFVFIGKLKSLISSLFPTFDVKLESKFNDVPPKLIGSLQSCIGWGWLDFCTGVQVVISTEGLRINGLLIFGGKSAENIVSTFSFNDSVSVLANPYSNTVSGVFINETIIPKTNIKVNPFSRFNIIHEPNSKNYGDLHLSSIIDGANLSWNYRENAGQINASLSNFEGISLALASEADLRVQSNKNPDRFIEIKNNGGITISHFSDGFSYYSPDPSLGNGRIWKIIRIYPEDTTEIFTSIITPKEITDTLLFTLIKYDPTVSENILFARYNTKVMNNSDYILNITPEVMDYSFTNGNDIIGPNSLDNVPVENGLLYLSKIANSWTESSFRINWKSSVPTNSFVRFGPTIAGAIYSQSSNQMTTNHDVFIPRTAVDSNWVYQIQCTNRDSESVFSEWRVIYPGITTLVTEELKIPVEYSLLQNYPNPFNPSTKIKYSIPQTSFVTLKIYDILGREIETLVNEEKNVGYYEVNFDANRLASGIYIYKMQAGNFVSSKKFILMK